MTRESEMRETEIESLLRKLSERDFELSSLRDELNRTEQLLDGWRAAVAERERELVDGETTLIEAELEVERLRDTLMAIRSGRAYRVMRFAWRLRQPFKRT